MQEAAALIDPTNEDAAYRELFAATVVADRDIDPELIDEWMADLMAVVAPGTPPGR